VKKILFIYNKPASKKAELKQQIHIDWVKDCRDMYNVNFWGKGYSDTDLISLQKVIDNFKPDFIYMTMRKRYIKWLPDLTNIKVPKIFVECDEYKWDSSESWYNQFDRVLCRQPWWEHVFASRPYKTIGVQMRKKEKSWEKIPVFKWSVREHAFPTRKDMKKERKHVVFMGAVTRRGYTDRKMIRVKYRNQIVFNKCFGYRYWLTLYGASAAICPTESNYGGFVPAKLFEYLASGTAVITNCDLVRYGIPELEPFVIKYKTIAHLGKILKMDFKPYHNKAIDAMRNHTHKVRYRELFG